MSTITTEIYKSSWIVVRENTDACIPPCRYVDVTFLHVTGYGQLPLTEFARVAEAILDHERRVDHADGRLPRRRHTPCPCGYPGATTSTPGPHHMTKCTLWRASTCPG